MAKSTALDLPQNINNQSVQLTSATTTVSQLIFTPGADDSGVVAIIVTSNDTAAINLQIFRTVSGTDYLLGTVRIPASSGVGGATASVDVLGSTLLPGLPTDNTGKPYLPVQKTTDTLRAAPLATMTAGKTCTVNVFGDSY
jgi:hypothetical protein